MNKSNNTVKPIVFVNNPIKLAEDDVIGFLDQVEMISCAIDDGEASMIGVIADYGTGKSSITEMLKEKYVKAGYPEPIKINMWDSLSEPNDSQNNNSNNQVSDLTKSFLFQLANGHDGKLGSYVNKLLSKNYGIISFASNRFKRLFWCFFASAICFVLYKISGVSGTGIMQHLPDWCNVASSWFKLLSPILILASAILAIFGIKDINVAFSHWKMTNTKSPEINDIFDIYRIIADEICPSKNKKQLVFIDDLDRIGSKKVVISFLKELYRFQDSICDKKSKFVFIVSVMPESNLLRGDQDGENSNVFSKIFDTTLYLKPIHFDDYDSILLQLIKGNDNKKQALEKLIGENIDEHLPDAFKWIKRGSNLTLRDLKERLNQAIAIMVSLVNKSYAGNSAADFQACTAVAYLESAFPDDYYRLIKNEVHFAEFIKKSMPIINESSENDDKQLIQKFNATFEGEAFSEKFKTELCMLIFAGIFDDDFRMYFYTYPKGSHIKTTAEREICDYILFPNQRSDYSGLSDAVNQAFETGNNTTVEQAISVSSSFPRVLLENDILFTKSAKINSEKLFYAFKRFCIEKPDSENKDIDTWKRVLLLSDPQRQYFIDSICSTLIGINTDDSFLKFRKKLILAFANEILNFSNVFIGDNIPIITSDEVDIIDNQLVSIQLINTNKLSAETYDYIVKLLLFSSLIEKDKSTFDKALNIFRLYSNIFGEEISDDAFKFLEINHYLDNETFGVIYQNIEDTSLADYINAFNPAELSDEYLSCLNQKCLSNGLSGELLSIMVNKSLLATPLSHYANQGRLGYVDIFESSAEQIIDDCEVINAKYPDFIVRIRAEAYLIRGISAYLGLYRTPYPLMTENEYVNEGDVEKAISLIDVRRIDDNNFEQVTPIHLKSYNQDELMLLLLTLFGNNNEDSLDSSVKPELVNMLDFAKLGFKQLDFSQRNEIFSLISDALSFPDNNEIIEFLKTVDCFIPDLEERITDDDEEYSKLIKSFDEFTDVSTEWLDEHCITCDLSEKLCDKLFDSKDYINYIIASTLRIGSLKIVDTIPFDEYLDVYKDSDELFNIMSRDLDFLERFQQQADFLEFDMAHITPTYQAKQHERFFSYIDTLTPEEKKSYYMSFGKFSSLNDSKLFRKLVCREDNMELLGDYKIYDHIKEQLWEDDPHDKGQFTKVWNKRWKSELGEKRLIEMD